MSKEKSWHNYLPLAARTYREGWKIAPLPIALHLFRMLMFDSVLVYVGIYLGRAVVAAVTEAVSAPKAILCVTGLFLIGLGKDLFRVLVNILENKIDAAFQLRDENRIIEKVSHVKYELFERPSYYDTFALVSPQTSQHVLDFVRDVHEIFVSIANLFVCVGIMISYRAWLGIFFTFAEMLFIFLYLKDYDAQYALRRKEIPHKRKLQYLKRLLFSKETMTDMKLNNSGRMILDKMDESYQALAESERKKNQSKVFTGAWSELYKGIRDGVLMLVYLLKILNGALTIADYTLLMELISKGENSASTPISYFSIAVDDLRVVGEYFDFINLADERTGKPVTHDKTVPAEIQLSDFTFRYPESEKMVLENIDLTIHPGEIVAIVGENGAGKTTLVKNILGLYETYGGSITMNGVDYRDITAGEIYDCFSVVMQDFVKYPLTIRDNVALDGGDEERMKQAIHEAGGDTIVENARHGADTYLNKELDEAGTDLSEGQWQKLMLARSLYRARGIVIFDEPTASLDPIAEENFYQNVIDRAKKDGKTVIVVTHRLACTAAADKIIVLKDGKIIEIGNHAQLMAKNGTYADYYRTQAEGYVNAKRENIANNHKEAECI